MVQTMMVPGFALRLGVHSGRSSLPRHSHDDPTICYVIRGGFTEYSGGEAAQCGSTTIASFGAHWAPNGLTFHTGNQFPARYRGGAFIAFHGGFDRAPLPNQGYNVLFVPMGGNGLPSGPAELFADGFAGSAGPLPATAVHRPVGVTEGPDGSLYVSDDRGGRIWRVVFRGP